MTLLTANQLTLSIGSRGLCRDFNFNLNAGEIWGVLGPNGVGKTTLLHSLAGLHAPESGTIMLQNKSLQSLSKKTIAQQIGLLFQSINIHFPQTVIEYIHASRFPHQAYFEKYSADDLAIMNAALQYTMLDSYQNRNIQTLSGGEKQRLAIAAILAQTPEIYLLDEPTNHLDMYYQLRMLTHFQYLARTQNIGVMMSLHDVNLAQTFCTHILLMQHDGNMQQGRVCDIMTEENLSRLYDVKWHVIARSPGDDAATQKVWIATSANASSQ